MVIIPIMLVGSVPTPLKNITSSFGISGKFQFMFQTTNQYIDLCFIDDGNLGGKNRFTFVFRVDNSRYSLGYLDSMDHNCGAHHRMYIALGNGLIIYHDLSITGNWIANWCKNHKSWLLHVVGLLSI